MKKISPSDELKFSEVKKILGVETGRCHDILHRFARVANPQIRSKGSATYQVYYRENVEGLKRYLSERFGPKLNYKKIQERHKR